MPYKKWENLTKVNILCLDYSEDMLKITREHLATYPHISCAQEDVGALPVEDGSCDIVLSMNGIHAFPDKPKAYGELYRALKPGGMLIASLLCQGAEQGDRRVGHPISSTKRMVYTTISNA